MNDKVQNGILKSKTLNSLRGRVQNDGLVMPNLVLNLIQYCFGISFTEESIIG